MVCPACKGEGSVPAVEGEPRFGIIDCEHCDDSSHPNFHAAVPPRFGVIDCEHCDGAGAVCDGCQLPIAPGDNAYVAGRDVCIRCDESWRESGRPDRMEVPWGDDF
jgi:phage terminase large subunit GpA-like protein